MLVNLLAEGWYGRGEIRYDDFFFTESFLQKFKENVPILII